MGEISLLFKYFCSVNESKGRKMILAWVQVTSNQAVKLVADYLADKQMKHTGK